MLLVSQCRYVVSTLSLLLLNVFLGLDELSLQSRRFVLQTFVQLHHQIDVALLLVKSFLHILMVDLSRFLGFKELGLERGFHLCVFTTHLFPDSRVFVIKLVNMRLQLGDHAVLIFVLHLEDCQVFVIASICFLNLLVFYLNFSCLNFQLNLFLPERSLGFYEFFQLFRVKFLNVFYFDNSLFSCINLTFDLSKQDLNLAHFCTLQELVRELILQFGVIHIVH